jgi:hypothetical protein
MRSIVDSFSLNAEELPINLHMEVIEHQSYSVYLNKHRGGILPVFYSSLDVANFRNLRDSALQVDCMFGSTYICDQVFYITDINKTKQ